MKRIAIITGASSGMGYDFSLMLNDFIKADELWLLARREDRLTALAAEIRKRNAAPAVRIEAMDIAGKSGVKRFAAMLAAAKAEIMRGSEHTARLKKPSLSASWI